MKILLLSFRDKGGGAAVQAYRIYKIFLNSKIKIHWKVIEKTTKDKRILVQKLNNSFFNHIIKILKLNKIISKIGNFKNKFTKDSCLIATNFSEQINLIMISFIYFG